MKIYVDFDDVITNTAQSFCKLAKKLFGIDVSFENIFDFNLQKSFHFTNEQGAMFTAISLQSDHLLSLEETPGAVKTLNAWMDKGHDVAVVTGRPFKAFTATKQWLDTHNLTRMRLIHVDKYGREPFYDGVGNISLTEFYTQHYDFAVEDSPIVLAHLEKIENCTVAVLSKPWNRLTALDGKRFIRCADWTAVNEALEAKEQTRYT